MRGDSALWWLENCGRRNPGWLGSFQIDHVATRSPKCFAAAVTNIRNSFGLGRVTVSRAPLVAQRGTGPLSVSRTLQPRASAASTTGSYRDQLYAEGSVASNFGFTRDLADGATSRQYMTSRIEWTPNDAMSLNAPSRAAGSSRARGASKLVVWPVDARAEAAGASSATTSTVMSRDRRRMAEGGLPGRRAAGAVVPLFPTRHLATRCGAVRYLRARCADRRSPRRHRADHARGRGERASAAARPRPAQGLPRRARPGLRRPARGARRRRPLERDVCDQARRYRGDRPPSSAPPAPAQRARRAARGARAERTRGQGAGADGPRGLRGRRDRLPVLRHGARAGPRDHHRGP